MRRVTILLRYDFLAGHIHITGLSIFGGNHVVWSLDKIQFLNPGTRLKHLFAQIFKNKRAITFHGGGGEMSTPEIVLK